VRKLTIVFHHAGGGHRSAAEALKETLTKQERPWDVNLLDLQELLDSLDIVRRFTGLRTQDTYNLILRRGWTRLTPQALQVLKATIRLYHTRIVKALRAYWEEHPTDMVMSVIPHFNRALAQSLRASLPETPFVTLITDLADYPSHFWIERESEYIIAGTERAVQQALAMGHSPDNVFRTSGMVLKPAFYQRPVLDRVAERKRLGLEPDCPTGIVLFGGHGSNVMVDIAEQLNQAGDTQSIMLCGHNKELAAELRSLPAKKAMAVVEFTSDVQHYMSLADFFIGKPGPGSISEALQFHLPVIVECNAKTLPQERYNAEWVTENGFGLVVSNFRDIAPVVHELIEGPRFEEFRRNASMYSNRALFEVSGILEKCDKSPLVSGMDWLGGYSEAGTLLPATV